VKLSAAPIRVSGVIVLTDMFGGTPSNLAISLMEIGKVEWLAGLNLPMLVKLARIRKDSNLDKAAMADRMPAGNTSISRAKYWGTVLAVLTPRARDYQRTSCMRGPRRNSSNAPRATMPTYRSRARWPEGAGYIHHGTDDARSGEGTTIRGRSLGTAGRPAIVALAELVQAKFDED